MNQIIVWCNKNPAYYCGYISWVSRLKSQMDNYYRDAYLQAAFTPVFIK